MTAVLTALGVLVVAGDLALVVVCWKRRSVLGGVLGACGVPVVALAVAAGPSRATGMDALLIAAIALMIGAALFGLGQGLERLLDDEGEDEGQD